MRNYSTKNINHSLAPSIRYNLIYLKQPFQVNAMKLRDYKRAFKVDLMTCFIGLIIFTVAIVIYSYKVNSENTLALSNSLLNTTLNHAVSQTTHHLKVAENSTSLSTMLLSNELNIINDQHLEHHVIKILKKTPFLFMYYIGDEQGNFIMGYRNKFGSISTKLIDNSTEKTKIVWKYRGDKEQVLNTKIETDIEPNDDFDARQRVWYQGAKKRLNIFWTDVYKFYNNEADNIYQKENDSQQLYGITIASPILNIQEQFKGVVGADISLDLLSNFFASLKIGKNGKTLVVNNARKIILFSDLKIDKLINGRPEGMKVNDIEDGWLKEGVQEFFKKYDKEFFYYFEGEKYFVKVHDFSKAIGKDWFLIMIVPENDFLGETKQARAMSLLVTSIMLFVSVLFCIWLSRSLSKPIESITHTMRQVRNLEFSDLKPLSSPIQEFQQMSDATTSMTQGLKAFLKYVPPSLVQKLLNEGEAGTADYHELNLSFFFSDIEGFTTLSEEIGPKELMTDLSNYIDQMTKVIVLENHGTIDKYIGDSVMAFWGAPKYIADHSRLACQSALDCRRTIDNLNEQRIAEGKKPFNTRIGIHTGLAIVGNLGSCDRINYTVIGDNVNLASRIEGLNKIYHTDVLV
ncbi:MAG: HAMP domain-containing protein, partial [Methylococcaceae bacterium]|nr:HAMP domain-containing protein [Methylococcaceae bacterium]